MTARPDPTPIPTFRKRFYDPDNKKVWEIKRLVAAAANSASKAYGTEATSADLTILIETLQTTDAIFALNKVVNGREDY